MQGRGPIGLLKFHKHDLISLGLSIYYSLEEYNFCFNIRSSRQRTTTDSGGI